MGISATFYDRTSGRLARGLYRRVASDVQRTAAEGAPAASARHDASVLDIGAGTGRVLFELHHIAPALELTGIDISPDMVAVARRNTAGTGIAVDVGDVSALPYADASFDVAVSTLSMHHWPDQAAAVAEIARVLRPGGTLLVYDFASTDASALSRSARDDGPFTGRPPLRKRLRLMRLLPRPVLARYRLVRS
ncbi:hypothetical protein GCM10023169_27070 [Georgenia halophila]|uniref:Methyltransferase type 11 domain-containing protein n=1 Tax=Georgenia halophila TaxID=620889 RepID=A0ABP8LEW8_9MICO